jgi:TonB family protein
VFAFGVLAYELLAYRRPFLGGSFSEISMRLLEEPAPPLAEHCPGCPAGVVTLVEHCLAKDPADRWQGFEPLVASLDALIAALEEGQPPPTLPDFAPTKRLDVSTLPVPTVRRPVALLGIAALLAAVLAVALPRWLRERPQSLGAEPAPTATAASTGAPAPPAGAGDAGGAQTPPPATGAEAGAEAAVPAAGGAPSAPRREPPRAVVASRPTVQAPIGPAAAGRGGSPSPPPAAAPRAPDPAATKTTDAAPATEAPPPAKASPAVSPPAVGGSAAAPSAGTVVHPRLLIRPVPDYPDEARRRRAVGRVELLVLVNETGKVVNTVVKNETPAGLGFAREAREAATRAAFAPATRDGQPGTDWTELVFDFHPP